MNYNEYHVFYIQTLFKLVLPINNSIEGKGVSSKQ